jgi:hypothetical protein
MNRVIGTAEINFVQEAFQASLFRKNGLQSAGDIRDWKALFGCSPLICQTIWGTLLQQGLKPLKVQPAHLLWLLHFLKSYGMETVCSSFLKCDEKTFRTHMWPLLQAISDLRVGSRRLTPCRPDGFINQNVPPLQISFDDRLIQNDRNRCKIILDGTDFPIREPSPFSSQWFSHKLNGPGLRYEIGVSIQKGWIVWAYGPFPAGSYPDLKIAQSRIVQFLGQRERLLPTAATETTRIPIL